MTAAGIHAHPRLKLGRQPASKDTPVLMLADVLSGGPLTHPASADLLGDLRYPMNGNDRIGDCFPVSLANDMIATSAICGVPKMPSEADVIALYSAISGYDPQSGENDVGCEMQDGLEKLAKVGLAGVKPVAFAKCDGLDTDTIEAGTSILGGCLWGVTLEVSQQAQTDAMPPAWDYRRSGEWGGHAVYCGAFNGPSKVEVESWEKRVATTDTFRAKQLDEVWFVIWPWHFDHPAFQQGIDLVALANAYHALTGNVLPTPDVPPAPTPGETITDADRALWRPDVSDWTIKRHVRENEHVAKALHAWAEAKGLV